MVAKRVVAGSSKPRRPPATTNEGREKELQALAYDLAEQQLRDGTASAQVVTHLLKSGAMREKLELENLRKENLLRQAKIEQTQMGNKMESLLTNALKAFTEYSGQEVEEDGDDFE